MHTLKAPLWWERWVSTWGMGSAGAGTPNHASISSSGPVGICVECVWEREMRVGGTRQGSQAATTRPKDVPLLFFQTFPVGTLFWLYSPFCLLPFYFFPSSFAPISLPALPSRSDCWGARIYLFSHCCSNLPWARDKCLALGVKRQRAGERRKREPTVLWGRRVESSCCGVDLTDAPRWHRLGQPMSASLSTIHLSLFVCAPSHLWVLKRSGTAELRARKPRLAFSSTVMEDFFQQTVQTMSRHSKTEGNSRWGKYGVF